MHTTTEVTTTTRTRKPRSPRFVEKIAMVCHEANRAWCIANGDSSQPLWTEAPDWQRDSALIGVRGVLAGNTPEQSHESWLAVKRADGWRHGPVKCPETKQHPCMVPYDELPPEQQAKDHLFVAVVNALAA